MIIPLSKAFYIWTFFICLSCLYNLFYIPFSIAFQVNAAGWFLILDIFMLFVLIIDIPLQLRFAYSRKSKTISTDMKAQRNAYCSRIIIWDILAVLPFDYGLYIVSQIGQISPIYASVMRLLRLLKFWRFSQSISITMHLSNWKLPQWIIFKLIFFYIVISHIMGCMYYLIGRIQEPLDQRYDGQVMFTDINNRDFLSNFPLFSEQTFLQKYVNFLYLSACTMGACIYGDIIPFGIYEQLYTFVTMFTARIFLAFLYAQAASYLIRIHSAYSTHLKKLNNIKKWMRYNKISKKVVDRVQKYQEILWSHYKGIDQETILNDLPLTMKNQTSFFLFKELIQNSKIFPKDDKGSALTLMSRLKLAIYPKQEFIIRQGEIGKQMFFILKGKVDVLIKGKQITTLTKGQALGEMALFGSELSVRNASAKCITTVSLGILKLQDYHVIEQNYPRFRQHISMVVAQREEQNERRKKESQIENKYSSIRRSSKDYGSTILQEDNKSQLIDKRKGSAPAAMIKRMFKKNEQKYSMGGIDDQSSNLVSENENKVKRVKKFSQRTSLQETSDNDLLNPPKKEAISSIMKVTPKRQPETVVEENQEDDLTTEYNKQDRVRLQNIYPKNQIHLPKINQMRDESKSQLQLHQDNDDEDQEENKEQQEEQKDGIDSQSDQDDYINQQQNQSKQIQQEKRHSFLHGILQGDSMKFIKRHSQKPLYAGQKRRTSDLPATLTSLKRRQSATPMKPRKVHTTAGKIQTQPKNRSQGMQFGSRLTQAIILDQLGKQNEASFIINKKKKRIKVGTIFTLALLPITIYNFIFVPLQFAFRIEYIDVFLIMEMVTIAAYFAHLVFHILVYRNIQSLQYRVIKRNKDIELQGGDQENKQTDIRRSISYDSSFVFNFSPNKRLTGIRFKICLDILALLPLGIAFQKLDINSPLLLIAFFKMFRLLKLTPQHRVLQYLKSKAVNISRILQVIITYYIFCHCVCCIWIMIGIWNPEINNSWIRRIPVEQGVRTGQKLENLDDLSNGTIYAHSLIFTVNTISHVAIGDVTAVTIDQRVLNAFIILVGTFTYALLFGNIAAMVADFAPQLFYNFQERYSYVMSKIPHSRVKQSLINRVKEYFDYQWNTQQGIDQSFIDKFPRQIKTDILLSRYNYAISRSVIFCTDQYFSSNQIIQSQQIDYTITSSVFRLMKYRTYMKHDFIFQAGSHVTTTIVILQGEAAVFGINNKFIGYLKPGSHFNTDCEQNKFKRRMVHIVAVTMVTIGSITKQDRSSLLSVYGYWKPRIELIESMLYQKAKAVLEQVTELNRRDPNDLKQLKKTLQNCYSFFREQDRQKLISTILREPYSENIQFDILENLRIALFQAYSQHADCQFQNPSSMPILNLKKSRSVFKDLIKGGSSLDPNFSTRRMSSLVKRESRPTIQGFSTSDQILMHRRVCFRNKFLSPFSKIRQFFDIFHMIFILYTSISAPLIVGFEIQMNPILIALEILVFFEIILFIVVNLRTAVLHRSGISRDLKQVFYAYRENGFWMDLIGVLPLNLVLAYVGSYAWYVNAIICVLRLSRMVQVWRLPRLLGRFQLVHRNISTPIQMFKVILFLFFLWHWTSCLLFWLELDVAVNFDKHWAEEESLLDASLARQYLLTIYFVMNIVSSVGYGDMYARNDLERIYIVFMMNLGDALFAVAFGLLAAITMNKVQQSQADRFFNKMKSVQQFVESFPIEDQQ